MKRYTEAFVSLQAHREVFEYLIEDFKTYKPIFAAIKNEYELMVNYQRDYLKQLEPLQQMLVTVTEQCDKQIMALRDKEKQGVFVILYFPSMSCVIFYFSSVNYRLSTFACACTNRF